jgi:hypothetical protein
MKIYMGHEPVPAPIKKYSRLLKNSFWLSLQEAKRRSNLVFKAQTVLLCFFKPLSMTFFLYFSSI